MKAVLKAICIVSLLVIAFSFIAPCVPVLAGPPSPDAGKTDLTYGANRRMWYKVARWALRQRK